ncbi:hypothetical protein [Novosphingobium cyanobacteriorum]|uniref:Lipoprotein n=1 Tax=Novosphingobium cyanobacteriorum TaxID=3024215 RepID=A0ABT6CHA3_9SPHN|nr:hypothetical protein [Novosphingobium cyanobacteriorum]MDF8332673.1 hypothetical protein [Novosphingobium cyanobacteriorum]
MIRVATGVLLSIAAGMIGGCQSAHQSNPVCEAEKARAQSSREASSHLPLGLKMPPNATLRIPTMVDGSAMGGGVSLSAELEVNDRLEKVADFYRAEFQRIGATIDVPENYKDLVLLHGQTRDGGYLMVGVDTRGRPTGVKVDIHYQADCL